MDGMTIANTTWKQIPVMTKMACGARQPIGSKDGTLTFKVGGGPMRFVQVKLNGLDLYDVEFGRVKRGSYERVVMKSAENIDAENLGEAIYHMVNR